MSTTGKERAALRAEAHHLDALVHIGQNGLTPTVQAALDDALRTRELVKIAIGKNAEVSAKDEAHALADAMRAEVVQVIGRTITLYRHNPELRRKAGDPPPWRA
jgi:RNA-binding protein